MSAPLRLGVLGDPLRYTRSPELHRAALAALGLEGSSEALRTPLDALGGRLQRLATEGWRGVNLTHPLKEAALAHVAVATTRAARSRSVNTITFDREWEGDTTDGLGMLDLLRQLDREPATSRVLLYGAGGAARSLALALLEDGAEVTFAARDPGPAAAAWEGPPCTWATWRGEDERRALERATVVVNATPLPGEQACPVASLPPGALAIDLVYGAQPTDWVRAARAAGREAWDGLGLLVHQARHSLERWTGRAVPIQALADAVGWPR
ncbi:MAG TPA: shikimate dehydrogenase [Candidatus Eisenbacteria bacterium]|nr:shikimate dehydrogenase [Candidatus Eisenbacteria bacterium]